MSEEARTSFWVVFDIDDRLCPWVFKTTGGEMRSPRLLEKTVVRSRGASDVEIEGVRYIAFYCEGVKPSCRNHNLEYLLPEVRTLDSLVVWRHVKAFRGTSRHLPLGSGTQHYECHMRDCCEERHEDPHRLI